MEVKERRMSAISLPALGIETACATIHVAQPRLDAPVRLDRKETTDLSTLVSSQNCLWRKCLSDFMASLWSAEVFHERSTANFKHSCHHQPLLRQGLHVSKMEKEGKREHCPMKRQRVIQPAYL